MRTLSIFGIIFSLIGIGAAGYVMTAECDCNLVNQSTTSYYTPPEFTGSGLIMLFTGLFFLVLSIINTVIQFRGNSRESYRQEPRQWQQPANPFPPQQPNYSNQQQSYPSYQQYGNYQQPNTAFPPQQQPLPQQQSISTETAPTQSPPTPPQQWPSSASGDDINRWAPKRNNLPPQE